MFRPPLSWCTCTEEVTPYLLWGLGATGNLGGQEGGERELALWGWPIDRPALQDDGVSRDHALDHGRALH